jgi:hypothetical protein
MDLKDFELLIIIAGIIGFVCGCLAIGAIIRECDDDDYVLP